MKTPDEVWARVDRRGDDECWPWTGPFMDRGYGQAHWRGSTHRAHRVVYMLVHGDDSVVGLDVDHLCRNPPCCNPAHLEAVTHAENVRRGIAGYATIPAIRQRAAAITHCPKGHEYTAENTYIMRNQRTGWVMRHCRTCDRDRKRARREAARQRRS